MTGRLYDLGPSGPEDESPGADRPPVSPGLNPSRRFAPCRSSSAKIPSSSSLNVPASCSVRPSALRVLSWTPLIFLARGEVVMSSGETKALSKFDGSYRRGTSPLRPDRLYIGQPRSNRGQPLLPLTIACVRLSLALVVGRDGGVHFGEPMIASRREADVR